MNFAIAVDPLMQTIEREEWPIVTLDSTFTQGCARFYFNYDTQRIVFTCVGSNMNKNTRVSPSNKSSYCCVPVIGMQPVLSVPMSYLEQRKAALWISDVFGSNTKTILWMIGDTIADFGNKRMFILKGPGGIGKSSVINIINAALEGMSCNLDSTLALSNKKMIYKSHVGLDKGNLLKIASKRLVLLSDLDITPDVEIDMQTGINRRRHH